jgi:hypothetical protein
MSTGEPEDVARLRAALASLRGDVDSPSDAGRPLDAGRIFDAVHGRLSVEERRAVVDELLANPAAAEAWRLARELSPETAAAEAPQREWSKWLAIAAVVVLAVGAGWRFLGTSPEPVYRGSETRTIASALAADALLPRARPVLRWTAVEGGRYRVRVLTPELELLEESQESTAVEHAVSAASLSRVPPGGRIFWQVEARVPDGGAIVSPTFSTRIE